LRGDSNTYKNGHWDVIVVMSDIVLRMRVVEVEESLNLWILLRQVIVNG
jgi:hypothetical protein